MQYNTLCQSLIFYPINEFYEFDIGESLKIFKFYYAGLFD